MVALSQSHLQGVILAVSDYCRTLEGQAYTRLFNFCMYVSNSFSCVLLRQYTLDPQYFLQIPDTL